MDQNDRYFEEEPDEFAYDLAGENKDKRFESNLERAKLEKDEIAAGRVRDGQDNPDPSPSGLNESSNNGNTDNYANDYEGDDFILYEYDDDGYADDYEEHADTLEEKRIGDDKDIDGSDGDGDGDGTNSQYEYEYEFADLKEAFDNADGDKVEEILMENPDLQLHYANLVDDDDDDSFDDDIFVPDVDDDDYYPDNDDNDGEEDEDENLQYDINDLKAALKVNNGKKVKKILTLFPELLDDYYAHDFDDDDNMVGGNDSDIQYMHIMTLKTQFSLMIFLSLNGLSRNPLKLFICPTKTVGRPSMKLFVWGMFQLCLSSTVQARPI